MEDINQFLSKLQIIVDQNPKYKLEAYSFVTAALNYTVSRLSKPRHLTGQELCEGIRQFAIDQYGSLVRLVFEHWGIKTTRDFGEIVFILVGAGLMSKTEEDSLADFENAYDFKEAFGKIDYNLDDLNLDPSKGKEEIGGYG